MNNSLWALSPTLILATGLLGLPALADTGTSASQLLPLETRRIVIEADPNRFNSAADQINLQSAKDSDGPSIADFLGAGFLEGLVDENGEVDLPLGLTVFDAMGATSVGFGSDF